MLQHRCAQPYINGLTKPGEVTVTMIGNTNGTVYSIILYKILTIQAVSFQDMSHFKIINSKMSMISQLHDCSESHTCINIMMFRNNHD